MVSRALMEPKRLSLRSLPTVQSAPLLLLSCPLPYQPFLDHSSVICLFVMYILSAQRSRRSTDPLVAGSGAADQYCVPSENFGFGPEFTTMAALPSGMQFVPLSDTDSEYNPPIVLHTGMPRHLACCRLGERKESPCRFKACFSRGRHW